MSASSSTESSSSISDQLGYVDIIVNNVDMARININALACFGSLIALTAAQGAGDAALHLVSQANVQKYGAMCLDGSAPGYYIRQGSDASKTKWKFHFQGGAWCLSASDCFGRSQTAWGSSSTWPQWLSHATDPGNNSLGFSGIMDANSTINPFGDWNFVWVMYCDGSSYTSNRDVNNPGGLQRQEPVHARRGHPGRYHGRAGGHQRLPVHGH